MAYELAEGIVLVSRIQVARGVDQPGNVALRVVGRVERSVPSSGIRG